MPAVVEDGDGAAIVRLKRVEVDQRGVLHLRFDLAPLQVDVVQLLGNGPGAAFVVGDQALDAERHIVKAASRVQARADGKAKVERRSGTRLPAGDAEQRGDPCMHAAGAYAFQALGDEDAVVRIEFDDVGHGAQCHQVEQVVQRWLG